MKFYKNSFKAEEIKKIIYKGAELVNWQGKECQCGKNNECNFKQEYDEGSSYFGMWVTDYFQFDKVSSLNGKTPRYTFGWVTHETNLFYTQEANGIMGLGIAKRKDFKPIYYTLKEDGFIDSLIFSLWFSKNGGKLFMGGYDLSIQTDSDEEIVWAPLISKDHYIIAIDGISVGNKLLTNFPTQVTVDSGVSLTMMTKDQVNAIDKMITHLWTSSGEYSCLGRRVSTGCFISSKTDKDSIEDFFNSYPSIAFTLLNDEVFHWCFYLNYFNLHKGW